MLLLIRRRVLLDLRYVLDRLLVLTQRQQHLLDLLLVKMDVRVDRYVFDYVTLRLQRVVRLTIRLRNQSLDLRLVSASH